MSHHHRTISRRDLYAAGEPLGECATHRRADGRIVCGGGGGDSSSASSTSTTTNATDRRIVADGASIGISADASNISISSTDAGAVAAGRDVALSALNNNATNTAALLQTADQLFAGQQKALDISATLANSLAAKASGTQDTGLQTASDNQTKAVAVVAIAAVAAYAFKKR